jgi:hypothetical protein
MPKSRVTTSRKLIRKVQAAKKQFQQAHRKGMASLKAHDFKTLEDAIYEEADAIKEFQDATEPRIKHKKLSRR